MIIYSKGVRVFIIAAMLYFATHITYWYAIEGYIEPGSMWVLGGCIVASVLVIGLMVSEWKKPMFFTDKDD